MSKEKPKRNKQSNIGEKILYGKPVIIERYPIHQIPMGVTYVILPGHGGQPKDS